MHMRVCVFCMCVVHFMYTLLSGSSKTRTVEKRCAQPWHGRQRCPFIGREAGRSPAIYSTAPKVAPGVVSSRASWQLMTRRMAFLLVSCSSPHSSTSSRM